MAKNNIKYVLGCWTSVYCIIEFFLAMSLDIEPCIIRPTVTDHSWLFYNPGQNIWHKIKKPSKTGQVKKVWYLLLYVFWLLLPKFNFWNEGWALGYVSTQIWDFDDISLFPKILSLKLFCNSRGNSKFEPSLLY